MTLIALAVALSLGVMSSHMEWICWASSAVTPENTVGVVTRCKGDNLVLREPSFGQHVFVFRNGESVASTSVPATGELKDRLLVTADSGVILTNLSSSDHGLYRVDVKISDNETRTHNIRLVIGEPPETVDGKLMIMANSYNDTVIRLMCGTFTSLGYPPVSAIWKDPTSQLLASTGFTEQYFTLDLPVEVAKSGRYCCQLDCRGPTECCIDNESPLRQCAAIDLPSGSKDRVTTDESVKNFINVVQELDKTHRRDNLPRGVTARYYRVEEVPCDQRDVCTDKAANFSRESNNVHKTEEDIKYLYNLNKTMDEFGSKIQDSIETFNKSVNTHCLKIDRQADKVEFLTEAMNEQQRKTEDWMSLMSNELKQIKSSLTETWTSRTADQLNDLKSNFSTIEQILVALGTKTDTWVSEIRNKVSAIENILQVLDGKTVELNQTAQLTLSSLMRARCQDKGYTLHEGRCWKFYPLKYPYAQAKKCLWRRQGSSGVSEVTCTGRPALS